MIDDTQRCNGCGDPILYKIKPYGYGIHIDMNNTIPFNLDGSHHVCKKYYAKKRETRVWSRKLMRKHFL